MKPVKAVERKFCPEKHKLKPMPSSLMQFLLMTGDCAGDCDGDGKVLLQVTQCYYQLFFSFLFF